MPGRPSDPVPRFGIEIGKAYVFRWLEVHTFTGIAISANPGYVTLRTKSRAYTVPQADVLREA